MIQWKVAKRVRKILRPCFGFTHLQQFLLETIPFGELEAEWQESESPDSIPGNWSVQNVLPELGKSQSRLYVP